MIYLEYESQDGRRKFLCSTGVREVADDFMKAAEKGKISLEEVLGGTPKEILALTEEALKEIPTEVEE